MSLFKAAKRTASGMGSLWLDEEGRRKKAEQDRKNAKIAYENKKKQEKADRKREEKRRKKAQERREKHKKKMQAQVNDYFDKQKAQARGDKSDGQKDQLNRSALFGGGAVGFNNAISDGTFDPNCNPYERLQQQQQAQSAAAKPPKLRRG